MQPVKENYKPTFGEPISVWVRWFAWKPVRTVDHGYLWLRFVYRRCIQKHDYLSGPMEWWWQYVKDNPNKEG
jgi:hypothetical protein